MESDGRSRVIQFIRRSVDAQIFEVSCLTGEGIGNLEEFLSVTVKSLLEIDSQGSDWESPVITRERHRFHVDECIGHLDRFLNLSLPADLAAEEIRLAMMELGKITGRVDVEELLDIIFRDFCIGK